MSTVTLELLRGPALAERLAAIWREPVEPIPLPRLRRRRILIPGVIGGEIQFAVLALIAEALRLRGAEVTALCCDAVLPACSLRKADHVEPACTRWCHANLPGFLEAARLPHRWYGALVDRRQRDRLERVAAAVPPTEVGTLVHRGLPLGEHVLRSIEGHFKVGRYDPNDPAMAAAASRFVAAALIMQQVAERILDELAPDKLLIDDGQKVKWGVIRAVAGRRGIPVEVIRVGPRAGTICFERDVPGLSPARMRGWSKWKDVPLDAEQDHALDAYMRRRATRPYENRTMCGWTRPASTDEVRATCGLSGTSRGVVLGMFPNLSYDSGTTSSAPVFATPADWVVRTIELMRERPEHHLVVKTNPTEAVREARDPLRLTLERRCAPLPANVHVLPPDTPLTAHDVLRVVNVVLAYTSTVIVEAAYLGKPVVMVGGGRHKGTGIATEVDDPKRYVELVERILAGARPAAPPSEIARRYTYAVFFRDLIPVGHVEIADRHVSAINLRSRAELLPGRNPALDTICRGILLDEPIEGS